MEARVLKVPLVPNGDWGGAAPTVAFQAVSPNSLRLRRKQSKEIIHRPLTRRHQKGAWWRSDTLSYWGRWRKGTFSLGVRCRLGVLVLCRGRKGIDLNSKLMPVEPPRALIRLNYAR